MRGATDQIQMVRIGNRKIRIKNNTQPVPLFYWSERKFIFKDMENYGDLLSKYLVEKISGRPVKFINPKKQPWYKRNKKHYLGIGSILHHATKHSIIWGSGIIDKKHHIAEADFRVVRGPETRKYLINLGYKCPEIYGDPALLLPLYFKPEVKKKYKIGIAPHYHDYKEVAETYKDQKDILVIDMMTMNIENVTREFLKCKSVISSSLHGLIVSHAYRIPAIWVEFSDKLFGDGTKFVDYLKSVDLQVYRPELLKNKNSPEGLEALIKKFPAIPNEYRITKLQEELIKNCPFG